MKKLFKNIMATLLLIPIAALSLGSAGSSYDPLVSRSWLEGEYRTELIKELDTHIAAGFNSVYDAIFSGRPLVPQGDGYSHSTNFGAVALYPAQTLVLSQGTSFSIKSGGTSVTIVSGVLIDLSDASEITGAFVPAPGRKYMLPEDSTGAITVAGESVATVLVDGYYAFDGEGRTHHRIFTDVALDSWYCPAVDYAYANGLFSGTSETEFSPSMAMTRGMFVTVLYRLYGAADFDAAGMAGFPDVSDLTAYYYTPVMWAASNGIVLGSDDGNFNPNDSVTREQMATIMYRYATWLGENTSSAPAAIQGFPDAGRVSGYAKDALNWAVYNSVMSGSDGYLLPLDTAQRSHVAQIIMNFATR
ncbi:MAG: S-layer homology domain-containing protein [Clostridiales bacterium]|nr:S-layer homology domain-containing protein [Clostridiales bacterium]